MINTIYVVTPCFNAAKTIDRTIISVISQAGDFRLRYHIQDGGSTDGTVELIEAWKNRIRTNSFPKQCHGIHLTYSSEKDEGMYDALAKGFENTNAYADDFMTWINADDILMPGALSLASALGRQFTKEQLSWFGGAVCNITNDFVKLSIDRPVSKDVIRLGLCDGTHWDFLQQEGTFFRSWLWRAVDPAKTISKMKLAGDWNLWRLMAEKAAFAQVSWPLGGFRISGDQLSVAQRNSYFEEIDNILPKEKRKDLMKSIFSKNFAVRRKVKVREGSTFEIIEESIEKQAEYRYYKVFGHYAHWKKGEDPKEKKIYQGKNITFSPVEINSNSTADIKSRILIKNKVFAFDEDWQFPAVTEKHAFLRILETSSQLPSDFLYVAFPWATLIDKINNKARDAYVYIDRFERFCDFLPKNAKKITVCQHIHGKKYEYLFQQAKIDYVFWSHATHSDVQANRDSEAPAYYSFPLYPVQITEALPEASSESDRLERKYLYSFIGAKANQYYLTEARNWILNFLENDSRGLILGRDSWHYQKVVYDHQIKGAVGQDQAEKLVDTSASDQFRESLKQSTFSLCPSGSGPNSIRLWESIGAGSIPVILADTWAPPGNQRLWEMAAVFCKEDPEEIKALPDRLAKIAADPEQLVSMRHAMRQLWLLYGPQSFVTDVQEFILSHTDGIGSRLTKSVSGYSTGTLIEEALNLNLGAELLRHCASALLLDPLELLERLEKDARLAMAIESARTAQSRDSALVQHFDAVLDHAKRKSQKSSPSAPAVVRNAAPKICLFGRHGNRTPLSYEPIRRVIGSRLEFVENPIQADLIVSGFNIDFRDNIDTLLPALKRTHKPKLAVISEEPLWDITWSGPFRGKTGQIFAKETEINYTFLGHETSDIFEFKRLPYFILTSNSYPVRYANMISRFAKLSPKEMCDRWAKASIPAAFFMEKRMGEAYSAVFPDRDVAALSAYRTNVAECTEAPGVVRIGKGWNDDSRRQNLPDWHLDKLARLDGQARIISAFENVHQRNYITEKIFDAFAAGAVPLYWASPKHRIFELISDQSFLNTYTLSPQESARKITSFTPDRAFAEAWLFSAARIVEIFSDVAGVQEERRRVAQSTLQSVIAIS